MVNMKFSVGSKEQLISAFTVAAGIVNPAATTVQEQSIRISAVIDDDEDSRLREYIVIESLNTSKCRFVNYIRADIINEGSVNLKGSWINQIVKVLKSTDVDTLDIEVSDNKLCFNLGSLGSIDCPISSSQDDFNPTGLSRRDIVWKPLCKDNPTITEVLKKGVSYCNKDSLIKIEANKKESTLQIGAKGLVQDFIFFRSSIEIENDFEFHIYRDIAYAITQLPSSSVISIYKGERTSGSAFVGDIYRIACGLSELVFYGIQDTNDTYKAQATFLDLFSIYQLEVNYTQLINSINIQSFGLQPHQDISFSIEDGSLLITGEDKTNPAVLSISSFIPLIDGAEWNEPICFPNKTLLDLLSATKANNGLLHLCFKTIEMTMEDVEEEEIAEIPKNMNYWLVAYPSIAYEGGHPFSILPMSAEL